MAASSLPSGGSGQAQSGSAQAGAPSGGPREAPPSAAGQEILVVDADDKVIKGLDRLLTRVGLIVTGTSDPLRARDQLLNKFFAVALIDIDTPTPGGGLELLQFARERSPLTSIVIMSARKSFELVVKAFRAGAADVVLKEPDVVPYLRERVLDAATELKSTSERNTLLEEVSETHEDFLRKMRDLSKQILDLEDRILGRSQPGEGEGGEVATINVVLVDDDAATVAQLEQVLTPQAGWHFRQALTGGEALDIVSQIRPQVVMVKENLPDLPGSMVVKTVKSAAPDAVTLLYTPPSRRGGAGELKLVDASRVMNLIPSFADHKQLLEPLEEIREALRQKTKERRYLQAFRQANFDFLQRYNALKQRIQAALEKGKK
ncbi:MAG TPA: response regulator [Polyangia bacterium]|nr:response regulator [Polyangia bacterium]